MCSLPICELTWRQNELTLMKVCFTWRHENDTKMDLCKWILCFVGAPSVFCRFLASVRAFRRLDFCVTRPSSRLVHFEAPHLETEAHPRPPSQWLACIPCCADWPVSILAVFFCVFFELAPPTSKTRHLKGPLAGALRFFFPASPSKASKKMHPPLLKLKPGVLFLPCI